MAPDLLDRIDRIMRELAELRAAVAADEKGIDTIHTLGGDDLAPENLLDTHAAAARLGYPQDTIRKWCREEGCGVKVGGVWRASIPRLRRRNGLG